MLIETPEVPTDQPVVKDDILGQLLVVAAQKAAQQEAQDALKKGFVTRGDINAAFGAFGEQLKSDILASIQEILMPEVKKTVEATVAETPGLRKSTIVTPQDELEANPVDYILGQLKTVGPEALPQQQKDIIWGLTFHALSEGMNYVPGEVE